MPVPASITKIYGGEPFDYDSVLKEYLAYAEELRPHVCDTGVVLGEVFEAGKNVLFEGAQATFLDIDHGTYPYVTSSNPTAANAATGSGVGPLCINHVVGVVKAYTTRVVYANCLTLTATPCVNAATNTAPLPDARAAAAGLMPLC